MSNRYPIHLLVLTKKVSLFQSLSIYFDKVSLTDSRIHAIKVVLTQKPNVIMLDDKKCNRWLRFLFQKLMGIPTHLYDAKITPLTYDLTPYYKPVTYHPKINETDLYVYKKETGWGEKRTRAIASGKAVINADDFLSTSHVTLHTSHLLSRPEEVYRQAKNDQKWLCSHLESDILPEYLAKTVYKTYTTKGTITP